MVELVIVVLVMGIIAATAAPRFSGALANRRADAVARRLVADLRFARQHAMSTSGAQEVHFFTTPSHGYRLPGVPTPGRSSVGFEVVYAVMAGSTTHTADFDGNEIVAFDAYGRPYSKGPGAGAALVPLVSGSISVVSGNSVRLVVVDPTTGRPSLP